MTAFVLLVICVVAQVLIAAGLGFYLIRRFRREKQQRQKEPNPSDQRPPHANHKP